MGDDSVQASTQHFIFTTVKPKCGSDLCGQTLEGVRPDKVYKPMAIAQLLLVVNKNFYSHCLAPKTECICVNAGCPFLDHLQGVQRVLEGWNEDKAVCHIGLCHSIYGSELFVSDYFSSVHFDCFEVRVETQSQCNGHLSKLRSLPMKRAM